LKKKGLFLRAQVGVTVWLFITVTLSCYRLGGWSFLSAQVCDFCCYLLFVHGKENGKHASIFAPFYTKTHGFTKTGSGQT